MITPIRTFVVMLLGWGSSSAALAQQSECGAAPASRWAGGSSEYRRGQVFGNGEVYLETLTGIASSGDEVFLFDVAASRIHVLDHSLRVRRSFGRKGQGPGEFSVPLIVRFDNRQEFRANYLSVSDSTLYVFDGSHVHAFRRDGTYRERVASAGRGIRAFSIFALHATPGGLLYAYDSADISGTRSRRLQTWRAEQGRRQLVHDHSLAPLPGQQRSTSSWSRDPQPLWAAHQSCVYWADGAEHRLYRLNLVTARVDTLRLPEHRVPPSDYDEETHRRLAERMGAPPPPSRRRDAPLVHWSAMVIDPDGHVWLKPWYRAQRLEGPVYRIDPAGRVHRERLRAFPIAFGSPGSYYAREIDVRTDEVLVVRYMLAAR